MRLCIQFCSFGTVYITCISGEARCVGTVIDMLLNANVEESRIGVITPYNDQKKIIKWWLSENINIKVSQYMAMKSGTD